MNLSVGLLVAGEEQAHVERSVAPASIAGVEGWAVAAFQPSGCCDGLARQITEEPRRVRCGERRDDAYRAAGVWNGKLGHIGTVGNRGHWKPAEVARIPLLPAGRARQPE